MTQHHPFPIVALFLGLSPACHVFDNGEIPKTCDELTGCGSSTEETGLEAVGTFGFAVASYDEDNSVLALEYFEDDAVVLSAEIELETAPSSGLEFNANAETFYFTSSSGDVQSVTADGDQSDVFSSTLDITALEASGDYIYALVSGSVYQVPKGGDGGEGMIINGDFGEGYGLFASPNGEVYALGYDGEASSVLAIDAEAGTASKTIESFDDGLRSVGAFVGHQDEIYSCSRAGAIYNVSDLRDGDTVPAAFASELLESNAAACGYDATTASYIIGSEDAIYRLERDGTVQEISAPPAGQYIAIDYVF
jgi:hypothetical protein